MYEIQMASANDKDRYDDKVDNRWECVVFGKSEKELLENLIEALNNEDIIIDNAWLRLKNPTGTIFNF